MLIFQEYTFFKKIVIRFIKKSYSKIFYIITGRIYLNYNTILNIFIINRYQFEGFFLFFQ